MALSINVSSSDWIDLRTRGYTSGMYLLNAVGAAIEYSTAATPVPGTTLVGSSAVLISGTYLWVRGSGDCELYTASEWVAANTKTAPVMASTSSSGGVRFSSALPEARLSYDRAPAEDIPTVTDPHAPDYSNAIAALTPNSPQFRMFGARVLAQTDGLWWWNNSAQAAASLNTHFFLEFVTDATWFKIRINPLSYDSKAKFMMWVDGKMCWPELQQSGNGIHAIKFEWATAKTRRIVMLAAGVGQLSFPEYCSLSAPTDSLGPTMMAVGDSYGTGADGWQYRLGVMLGYKNIHKSTEGGTGYVQTNTPRVNFLDRIDAEVIPVAPDDVFFVGSLNDIAQSPAAVYANAKACYSKISAALPNTRIWVAGPQWPQSAANAAKDAIEDAVRRACSEVSSVKAFVSTKGWIKGAGSVSANDTSSSFNNCNTVVAADLTHLVPGANNWYARRLADAFKAAGHYL